MTKTLRRVDYIYSLVCVLRFFDFVIIAVIEERGTALSLQPEHYKGLTMTASVK